MNRTTIFRLARLEQASTPAKPARASDSGEVWSAVVDALDQLARAKAGGRELTPSERELLNQMGQCHEA